LKNASVTVDSMSPGVIAALANLTPEDAEAVDEAIALLQAEIQDDLDSLDAAKADVDHTQAATTVTVAAISGIVGATVQAVLAELRALGPQPGDIKLSMVAAVPSGWVACNDGTIGDATSGATNRANADCADLYAVLWNNVSDTYAPVTSGRGVSAAADFAAHKPIALTKMLGRALAIAGAGSGLTARSNGQTVGAETATIGQANLPDVEFDVTIPAGQGSHNHLMGSSSTATVPGAVSFLNLSGSGENTDNATLPEMTGTAESGGSGTALSIMPPASFLHAFLKL
jgi:hypothetical protein